MAGLQRPAEGIAPVAPSPSLLTAARRADFGGPDWKKTGVAWNPATCIESNPWQTNCGQPPTVTYVEEERAETAYIPPGGSQYPPSVPEAGDGIGTKYSASPFGRVAVDPFIVYTWIECDWQLMAGEGSLDGAAQAQSEVHSAWMLSKALWMGEGLADVATDADTGALVNPTLRSSAYDLSGYAASDPATTVALLLTFYSHCTGGSGGATLHIPDLLIPDLYGASDGGKTIDLQGNKLVVPSLGANVSPGPGYPIGASDAGDDGFGPWDDDINGYTGNEDDEAWIYVTGPVEYALTPPELVDTQDAYVRQNKHVALAENEAIVRFDPCCVFAAKADVASFAGIS